MPHKWDTGFTIFTMRTRSFCATIGQQKVVATATAWFQNHTRDWVNWALGSDLRNRMKQVNSEVKAPLHYVGWNNLKHLGSSRHFVTVSSVLRRIRNWSSNCSSVNCLNTVASTLHCTLCPWGFFSEFGVAWWTTKFEVPWQESSCRSCCYEVFASRFTCFTCFTCSSLSKIAELGLFGLFQGRFCLGAHATFYRPLAGKSCSHVGRLIRRSYWTDCPAGWSSTWTAFQMKIVRFAMFWPHP